MLVFTGDKEKKVSRRTRMFVGFLRILMALRRKGQNFLESYFGRILDGDLLVRE